MPADFALFTADGATTLQCIAKQEFAIGPSEADILEHPVVELSELGAFLAAPAPFAQQSENVARGVVQREKRIALPGRLRVSCQWINSILGLLISA